jgi:Helix-turn-helix domain
LSSLKMSPDGNLLQEVAVKRTAMSTTELRRVEVFGQVQSGALRLVDAEEKLALSYRHIKRLWRRYRQQGPGGLQHGNAGRASHRAKPRAFREQVLRLVREKYGGHGEAPPFGPTLAAEHLAHEDHLSIDAETLRRWMLEERLWSRQRGQPRAHRQRRARKEHFGELVQLDGSFHAWFEGRGPRGCLMNMVDDATGTTVAHLCQEETTWDAVAVLRLWIAQYGVPLALYTDWKNVYKVASTPKQELRGEEPLTQFGRMCAQLGIRILGAHSPQAKGRVERRNGVHQDRLVKKLRRQGICANDTGNRYLQAEYLADLNRRFAKAPARPENYHRPAPCAEELETAFRLRTEHFVSNDWVVRHQGRFLQLHPRNGSARPRPAQAIVWEHADGQLEVSHREEPLGFEELPAALRKQKPESATGHTPCPRGIPRPGPDHPYKRNADREIRERRRRLLAQAVAARAAGSASAPPAAGSAPAPPAVIPTSGQDISVTEGTF